MTSKNSYIRPNELSLAQNIKNETKKKNKKKIWGVGKRFKRTFENSFADTLMLPVSKPPARIRMKSPTFRRGVPHLVLL